jgi:hypothetical protein
MKKMYQNYDSVFIKTVTNTAVRLRYLCYAVRGIERSKREEVSHIERDAPIFINHF